MPDTRKPNGDPIPWKIQCDDTMVSVAPASRRLLALSWNSNTAGKMPALPRHTAASVQYNFRPVRHQPEMACSFDLHHDGKPFVFDRCDGMKDTGGKPFVFDRCDGMKDTGLPRRRRDICIRGAVSRETLFLIVRDRDCSDCLHPESYAKDGRRGASG